MGLAIAAAAGLAAHHALRRSALLRHAVARQLLHAPLAGSALSRYAAARWCRSLATLLGAGVPLADALATLERTAGHPVFEHATAHIAARVLRGARLADGMQSAGCFPDDVVQPIAVAEETGALDTMRRRHRGAGERQLDARLDAPAALGEPLIVIVLRTRRRPRDRDVPAHPSSSATWCSIATDSVAFSPNLELMTPAPLYSVTDSPESTLLALAMLPPALQYAFAVVVGLCVGSFLNVVVHRLPR